MTMKKWLTGLLLGGLAVLAAGCYGYKGISPNLDDSKQRAILERSADVVRSMQANPGFHSFNVLLQQAKGLLVFPDLIKAALIYGAEGGNGVLLAKDHEGYWSAPAFYTVGGGSFGLQAGAKGTSLVLVFMNNATLMGAVETGLTLGVDASVAAGPSGAALQASTITARDVYYFSQVEGLYAGLSLDGSIVKVRNSYNEAYYGVGTTARDIILRRKYAPGSQDLQDALLRSGPYFEARKGPPRLRREVTRTSGLSLPGKP